MSGDKASQRLYLGLDLSTQQLKGVVIDEQLKTVAEEAISFNDKSLLVHNVQPNGFVVDENDKRCITTPVFVFLEAIGKINFKNHCRSNSSDLFRCFISKTWRAKKI
jgi:xylulokinase